MCRCLCLSRTSWIYWFTQQALIEAKPYFSQLLVLVRLFLLLLRVEYIFISCAFPRRREIFVYLPLVFSSLLL